MIENFLLLPGCLALLTIYSLLPAYWYHWVILGHDYPNVYFLSILIANFCIVIIMIDLVRSRLLARLLADNAHLNLAPSDVYQQ